MCSSHIGDSATRFGTQHVPSWGSIHSCYHNVKCQMVRCMNQPQWDTCTHYKIQFKHYHVHKNLPLVPVLSQMNPIHTLHPVAWRSILISSHLSLGIEEFRARKMPTDTAAGRSQCSCVTSLNLTLCEYIIKEFMLYSCVTRDLRLPARSKWGLRSSEMLPSIYWQLVTDVSVQHIGPETSGTTNQRCITSQKSEDLNA